MVSRRTARPSRSLCSGGRQSLWEAEVGGAHYGDFSAFGSAARLSVPLTGTTHSIALSLRAIFCHLCTEHFVRVDDVTNRLSWRNGASSLPCANCMFAATNHPHALLELRGCMPLGVEGAGQEGPHGLRNRWNTVLRPAKRLNARREGGQQGRGWTSAQVRPSQFLHANIATRKRARRSGMWGWGRPAGFRRAVTRRTAVAHAERIGDRA
jgi:hypothetical protein